MLQNELILIASGMLVQLFCLIAIQRITRQSPIGEWIFLKLAFLSEVIFHICWMITAYAAGSTSTGTFVQTSFRIGWFFVGLAFLFWALSLILPNFEASYQSVIMLILIVAVDFGLSIAAFSTAELLVVGRTFKFELSLVGFILFFSSAIVYLIPTLGRDREIQTIIQESGKSISLLSSLRIFVLLFLLVIFSSLIAIFKSAPLPGFTFAIFFAIQNLFFVYQISKNQYFFYLSPIVTYSIIVVERETSIVIFSKGYSESDKSEEILLGSLLSALNLSLTDTLKSTDSVRTITFGDQVILINPGKFVTSFLIVSKDTFITKSISKFITLEFESQFSHILGIEESGIHIDTFAQYEETTDELVKYIPL